MKIKRALSHSVKGMKVIPGSKTKVNRVDCGLRPVLRPSPVHVRSPVFSEILPTNQQTHKQTNKQTTGVKSERIKSHDSRNPEMYFF